MHKYLLLAAFSVATGYLLMAPDAQPYSAGKHAYMSANGGLVTVHIFR